MRLNLTILADYLDGYEALDSHLGDPYRFTFDTCRVWAPDEQPSPSVLYLCANHVMPPAPRRGHVSFVCIGALPADYPREHVDYLCVDAHTDILRLINDVIAIFARLDEWDQRMQDACTSPRPLMSLSIAARDLLDNDLCCWDAHGYLLCHSRPANAAPHPGYPSTSSELADPSWYLARLGGGQGGDADPQPRPRHVAAGTYWGASIVCDVFDETGDALWSSFGNPDGSPWLSTTSLEQMSGDALLGHLTLDDTVRPFRPSDASLLYHASVYFGSALLQDDSLRVRQSKPFNDMVESLVVHGHAWWPAYDAQLRHLGWQRHDAYRCVAIASVAGQLDHDRLVRIATLVQRRLPGCYPFRMPDGTLLVIIDIAWAQEHGDAGDAIPEGGAKGGKEGSKETGKEAAAPRDLPTSEGAADSEGPARILASLLAAHSCHGGTSDVFDDFARVGTYQRQAADTLRVGAERSPGKALHRFEDSVLDLLLQNATGGLPAESYCTEQVRAVVAYDERHGSQLVRTLGCWLASASPETAAQALGVHKTTLYYRLRRIQEMTGLTLDDHRTRLYLSMLFEVVPALSAATSRPKGRQRPRSEGGRRTPDETGGQKRTNHARQDRQGASKGKRQEDDSR